jgi:hypothetical protein
MKLTPPRKRNWLILNLKLAEVATAMRDLGASQAAYAAMQKAPVYTPIVARQPASNSLQWQLWWNYNQHHYKHYGREPNKPK